MSELLKLDKHEIDGETIDRLYQKVNTGRRYHVEVNSPQLITELIELYFQDKGVGFWDMPEVQQAEFDPKTRILTFYTEKS